MRLLRVSQGPGDDTADQAETEGRLAVSPDCLKRWPSPEAKRANRRRGLCGHRSLKSASQLTRDIPCSPGGRRAGPARGRTPGQTRRLILILRAEKLLVKTAFDDQSLLELKLSSLNC